MRSSISGGFIRKEDIVLFRKAVDEHNRTEEKSRRIGKIVKFTIFWLLSLGLSEWVSALKEEAAQLNHMAPYERK